MELKVVFLCFCALIVVVRADMDNSQVHFEEKDNVIKRQSEPIANTPKPRPTSSRCLRPCTRILKPVRAVQNGNVVLLPNNCEFKNAQCKAADARSGPLLLAEDQTNIVWPVLD